jgi:hypothetical protein
MDRAMNATTPARLRIVADNMHRTTVAPYGFDMECEYEYDPGEEAIHWPTSAAHPGSPANVQVLVCRIGGVDVIDMLSFDQTERIEEEILKQLEN